MSVFMWHHGPVRHDVSFTVYNKAQLVFDILKMKECMWLSSTDAVISSTAIFGEIDNNTLYESKILFLFYH